MQEKIETPLDSIAFRPGVCAFTRTAVSMEMQMDAKSSVLLENAQKFQDLAEDFRLAARGQSLDLSEPMPVLLDWKVSAHLAPHLIGHAVGHPVLGNRHITTSQLFFLDMEVGLARTLSRWYRLGAPLHASEAPKRH